MNIKSTQIDDYTYHLPESKIAKYPLSERDGSKLLSYDKGNIKHIDFKNIPEFYTENDLIVFNDTKVIQARLIFEKPTGAKIEIFCLEPYEPSDYERIFQEKQKCTWACIIGNKKKWKEGYLALELNINKKKTTIRAKKQLTNENADLIQFSWDNTEISFGDILESMGETPIPPYLKRQSEESDKERYQTVYSKIKGSVAAPTAGLHFTNNILNSLKAQKVKTETVTLHVGAGTFKPVKSLFIGDHEMHTEHFSFNKNLLKTLIKHKGNITATGTTTVRTLESIYWLGVKILEGKTEDLLIKQWEVYDLPDNIDPERSINALITYMNVNTIETFHSSTQIIIVPGYTFKIINKLITNFHMPKSTLLLLIAAFIGNDWKKVYDYALNNGFRFLSYGDSSFLIPK